MPISFSIHEGEKFTLVEFDLGGDPISPEELRGLEPPEVDARKGVVVSGRGPIWLFGALVHHYHYALWVATHDPRLGGGVVVATHTPTLTVGDVVPLED